MRKANNAVRLRHMLDAARKARALTQQQQREELDKDEVLALALIRLLEVLGEAAASVSEGYREEHPEIPWRPIVSARNRLIHGYHDVDLDIVWSIVTVELPPLIAELEKLVPPDGR